MSRSRPSEYHRRGQLTEEQEEARRQKNRDKANRCNERKRLAQRPMLDPRHEEDERKRQQEHDDQERALSVIRADAVHKRRLKKRTREVELEVWNEDSLSEVVLAQELELRKQEMATKRQLIEREYATKVNTPGRQKLVQEDVEHTIEISKTEAKASIHVVVSERKRQVEQAQELLPSDELPSSVLPSAPDAPLPPSYPESQRENQRGEGQPESSASNGDQQEGGTEETEETGEDETLEMMEEEL